MAFKLNTDLAATMGTLKTYHVHLGRKGKRKLEKDVRERKNHIQGSKLIDNAYVGHIVT